MARRRPIYALELQLTPVPVPRVTRWGHFLFQVITSALAGAVVLGAVAAALTWFFTRHDGSAAIHGRGVVGVIGFAAAALGLLLGALLGWRWHRYERWRTDATRIYTAELTQARMTSFTWDILGGELDGTWLIDYIRGQGPVKRTELYDDQLRWVTGDRYQLRASPGTVTRFKLGRRSGRPPRLHLGGNFTVTTPQPRQLPPLRDEGYWGDPAGSDTPES